MTDQDFKKMKTLSEKYTILCQIFAGVYPVQQINDDGTVVVGNFNKFTVDDIEAGKFFVSIPLSQIKKGVQPQ